MNKPLIGTGIIGCMVLLAGIDAFLVEKDLLTDWRQEALPPQEVAVQTSSQQSSAASNTSGVPKRTGPDVVDILPVLGFQVQETSEPTLIQQIIPNDLAVAHSRLLLKDNDRVGIITWVEHPQVKVYFLALKEALHSTFSPQIQDLVDEKQQREGKPTRDLLTFIDPVLSEERIVFIRVQERLYEFHVAEGMDKEIFELVEVLTQ